MKTKTIKKYSLYIIGILILGFGLILNTKAGLGVSAINSVPYAVSQMTRLSFGNATTILYIIFVIAQILIYKHLDIKILLQIPFSYVMGVVLDVYDQVLNITIQSHFHAYVLLIIAIITTALGAYLIVTLDLVPNPADGMVKAISKVIKKEFGKTKMMFDIAMMIVTIVMTYTITRSIIGIGIGTILSALFIGQVIVLYNRYLTNYLKKLIELS